MKAFLGLGVRNFESAIAERDSVIGDLQAQLRALQDADQRDFLNDNSDQLGVVIHAKNEVIQELRVELLAEEAAARNVMCPLTRCERAAPKCTPSRPARGTPTWLR